MNMSLKYCHFIKHKPLISEECWKDEGTIISSNNEYVVVLLLYSYEV